MEEQSFLLERLIQKAQDDVNAGHLRTAFTTLCQACQTHPSAQHAWSFAADLATHLRDWPALTAVARQWTQYHPARVDAWKALARSYFEQSQFDAALTAFDSVLDLESEQVGHLVSAARMATAAQRHDKARTLLNAAEALDPHAGEVLYALARLHQLTGNLPLAQDYCRRAVHALPGFPPAYTLLGLLTEGRLTDAEFSAISQLVNQPGLHAEYRAMLHFTRGDALDHKGDYANAFAAWQQANLINQQISAQEGYIYNAPQHDADVPLLAQLFQPGVQPGDGGVKLGTEALVPGLAGDGGAELGTEALVPGLTGEGLIGDGGFPQPIFVVGMPRSGTTLIESILASHSEVNGAGELPMLVSIYDELMDVARTQGVSAARRLINTNLFLWRQRYLEALPRGTEASMTASQIKFIVDKQPLNYRCIGLIRLMFPQAPILYTRRNALDVCLSIYRHNFAKNWPCANNISDIAHYYAVHTRMMALWEKLDPSSFHTVDHAALIADADHEIRRLLAFTGLQAQDACFSPHLTKRPVATFSAVQVQQPVSSRYSGRSVHYLPWLSGFGDGAGFGVFGDGEIKK